MALMAAVRASTSDCTSPTTAAAAPPAALMVTAAMAFALESMDETMALRLALIAASTWTRTVEETEPTSWAAPESRYGRSAR